MKGGSPKLVRGSRPILDAVKATDFADLDLLPADFTYRHMDIDLDGRPKPQRTLAPAAGAARDDYDVVVLDTPPSLSLVSENVLRASDLVLVPLIPTVLSVRTFDQMADFVARAERPPAPAARLLLDARPPAQAAPRDPGRAAGGALARELDRDPVRQRGGADGGPPRTAHLVRAPQSRPRWRSSSCGTKWPVC